MKNNITVLITGGFDPLHSGHISYIAAAKTMGDRLVIGANSDEWLIRKKKKYFLPFVERKVILENIKGVDQVIDFNDDDGSAIDAIRKVIELHPRDTIIFANGGDRTGKNIPEMSFNYDKLLFAFGVGGTDKKNSSSWILDKWNSK